MIRLYLDDKDARSLLRLCEGRVAADPHHMAESWEARVGASVRVAMSRAGAEMVEAGRGKE